MSDFYRALAPYLDRIFPAEPQIVEFLAMGKAPGAVILEAGCATGNYVRALLDRGFDSYGIDLSRDLVTRAVSKKLAGRVELMDMLAIESHPSAPFDAIFSIGNTLSHLPSLAAVERFLSAAGRTLKDGGELILQLINSVSIADGEALALPIIDDGDLVFRRRYRRTGEVIRFAATVERAGSSEEIEQELLVVEPEWLSSALTNAGADEPRLYGGFDGSPFDPTERLLIIRTQFHSAR